MFGFQSGLWAGDAMAPELLVRMEDPAPGISGAQFLAFSALAYNNLGQAAFVGTYIQPSLSAVGSGIWMGSHGQLQRVLKDGDLLPDSDLRLLTVSGVLLNDAGELALGLVATNAAGMLHSGLWAGTPGALHLVALQGEPVPGLDPEVTFGSLGTINQLEQNGHLAFPARITGPGVTSNNDQTLWLGTLVDPRLLLREGDTVEIEPGVAGVVNTFSVLFPSIRPGTTAINSHGQMVVAIDFEESLTAGIFLARLDDTTGQLILTRVPGGLELSWSGDGGVLESGETVTGPWTPFLNQANPQILEPLSDEQYFRLVP
jgi:hypothetical protein